MISRRKFLEQSSFAGMALGLGNITAFSITDSVFSYQSSYINVKLLKEEPTFTFFSTDNLGKKQFSSNPILEDVNSSKDRYESKHTWNYISYFHRGKTHSPPVWKCEMEPKSLTFRTRWTKDKISPFPFPSRKKLIIALHWEKWLRKIK